LLRNGVDVDAVTNTGKTALHRAAGRGRVALAKLLVNSGTRVDVADAKGETAADRAKGTKVESRCLRANRMLAQPANFIPDPHATRFVPLLTQFIYTLHNTLY
jgi:ankyrin repeat protein